MPIDPAGLSAGETALFLDVDGTLLELARHPDAVQVPDSLRDVLRDAERRLGGALALISGRPIAQLDRLLAPPRLPASGLHGAEIRYAADAPSDPLTRASLPPRLVAAIDKLVPFYPGAFVEHKPVGLAVHYRQAADVADELVAALGALMRETADPSLELMRGRSVVEIKPRGYDKGGAIARFMGRPPFAARTPVFIADEEIDRPGFDAVQALGGLAYSVGTALPGLSGCFASPGALRDWLGKLAP